MLDHGVLDLMIRLPVVLLALTVHEFSHAYFALRMGDPTAYYQGRCTLNPLKHLDPLGAICLLFAPIGWARAVPINPLNFHDRRKGILVSTAAGPASNLVQALFFALLLRAGIFLAGRLGPESSFLATPAPAVLMTMCVLAVIVNVGLAVFNCLPLYPLDGFHITLQLVRPQTQKRLLETARFGPIAVIALVLVGNVNPKFDVLSRLIWPPARFILTYLGGFDVSAEM